MGVGDLFEFVSLPERKTFRKKTYARCLGYFGRFYSLLSQGRHTREDLSELRNLVDYVEDYCALNLSDVKNLIEDAYRNYLKGNIDEAEYLVLKAFGRVKDKLTIEGGF